MRYRMSLAWWSHNWIDWKCSTNLLQRQAATIAAYQAGNCLNASHPNPTVRPPQSHCIFEREQRIESPGEAPLAPKSPSFVPRS